MGDDIAEELALGVTLHLIILLGTSMGVMGSLLTRGAIEFEWRYFDPILGLFVAIAASLLVGAGTIRAIMSWFCAGTSSGSSRRIVVLLNVATAAMSAIMWCIFVVMWLPSVFSRL